MATDYAMLLVLYADFGSKVSGNMRALIIKDIYIFHYR